MAKLGALPFFMIALSSLISGWVSDRMIARGGSPTRVRKFFAAAGLFMGMLVTAATPDLPEAAISADPTGVVGVFLREFLGGLLFGFAMARGAMVVLPRLVPSGMKLIVMTAGFIQALPVAE